MENPDIFETELFIYNYITKIYHLSSFEYLHDQNIIWGYTDVEHQVCVIRGTAQYLLDEIAHRIASQISVTSTVCKGDKTEVYNQLHCTHVHSKTVFLHSSNKRINSPKQGYRLKYCKGLMQTKKAFGWSGDNIFSHYFVSDYTDRGLFYLVKKSLLGIELVYNDRSSAPIGVVILFPLKEVVILEFIFAPTYTVNSDGLNELAAFVLNENGFTPKYTLVIAKKETIRDVTKNGPKEICEIRHNRLDKPDSRVVLNMQRLPENAVLKSEEDYLASVNILRSMGLPKHPDLPKNWDSLAAFMQIVGNSEITEDSAILDAGGEYYSVLLHQLSLCGYRNLYCLNLVYSTPKIGSNIHYKRGDITKTGFRNRRFAAVTCLSVIEHGVDLKLFFAEMSRLLITNGLLFISTDYWEKSVNTQGKQAFNTPIKIFNKHDVQELIKTAKSFNLELTEPADLTCRNKMITFEGLRYTFLYLTFKKSKARSMTKPSIQ